MEFRIVTVFNWFVSVSDNFFYNFPENILWIIGMHCCLSQLLGVHVLRLSLEATPVVPQHTSRF